MKDWKVGLTLISIYMLLFSTVVAHLIFDLETQFVQIFCWQVDRLTMFILTLILLTLAYGIELGLTLVIRIKRSQMRLIGIGISLGLLILGMALLQFSLNNDMADRLVWFDSALLIVVAAWSIVFWLATRQWRHFA
jgi:hypothetical protein